jgi:hypothetical protein
VSPAAGVVGGVFCCAPLAGLLSPFSQRLWLCADWRRLRRSRTRWRRTLAPAPAKLQGRSVEYLWRIAEHHRLAKRRMIFAVWMIRANINLQLGWILLIYRQTKRYIVCFLNEWNSSTNMVFL